MSLVLFNYTVWYTDSLGEQGVKVSLFVLVLIIGMKAWEPGANE